MGFSRLMMARAIHSGRHKKTSSDYIQQINIFLLWHYRQCWIWCCKIQSVLKWESSSIRNTFVFIAFDLEYLLLNFERWQNEAAKKKQLYWKLCSVVNVLKTQCDVHLMLRYVCAFFILQQPEHCSIHFFYFLHTNFYFYCESVFSLRLFIIWRSEC